MGGAKQGKHINIGWSGEGCVSGTPSPQGVYLTNGYIQLILRRDECEHTSTSPQRAQSMAKPRSREANMEIKYRNKQANIEM